MGRGLWQCWPNVAVQEERRPSEAFSEQPRLAASAFPECQQMLQQAHTVGLPDQEKIKKDQKKYAAQDQKINKKGSKRK